MSNEEVVLQMIVNRLEQLLEAHEDLKSKWSAEITEIIHLGKGVIVEAPRPTAQAGPSLNSEQLSCLIDISYSEYAEENYNQRSLRTLRDLLEQLQALTYPEEPNDEPDDNYMQPGPVAGPVVPTPPAYRITFNPAVGMPDQAYITRIRAAMEAPPPDLFPPVTHPIENALNAAINEAMENTPEAAVDEVQRELE